MDVLGLFDKSGGKVVEYTYDSWGKLISTTGSKAGTLGAANPFRYRGYYYDSESGLYYLNSRYYDPETGRFVNADGQINSDLLGKNLFAYCNNNPVNHSDPDGKDAFTDAAIYWDTGFWWLTLIDGLLPFGDAIYVTGIVVTGALAVGSLAYAGIQARSWVKERDKAEEATKDATLPPKKTMPTYYHVTSNEAALKIWASGIIIGSKWEGGHVFAWRSKPTKKAIASSGAHNGSVVISFQTNAAFETDIGITDPYVKSFGPVRTVAGKSVVVYNVTIAARYY